MAVTRAGAADPDPHEGGVARGRRRGIGVGALAIGMLLVIGARLVPGLGGPPLYDGVVPVGPYLWVAPSPGQQGGAQGATATVAVTRGQNDLVAVATPEMLPQAQVLAVPGALELPAGATSLSVSVTPVPASVQPSDGVLASNVYRFELVDQTGAAATGRASGRASIVLRSADPALANGVVERFDGSTWIPLKTAPPGVNGAYLAIVTNFGDYAVVRPGAAGSPASSAGPASSGTSRGSASGSSSSSAAATAPGRASPGEPASALPTAPASAARTATDSVIPIAAGAVVLVLVVAIAIGLVRGRPGPPPPSPPYRGAHRIQRRR